MGLKFMHVTMHELSVCILVNVLIVQPRCLIKSHWRYIPYLWVPISIHGLPIRERAQFLYFRVRDCSASIGDFILVFRSSLSITLSLFLFGKIRASQIKSILFINKSSAESLFFSCSMFDFVLPFSLSPPTENWFSKQVNVQWREQNRVKWSERFR